MNVLYILLIGAVSGLAGAAAMYAFMRGVGTAFSRRVDMILALGSFFTGGIEGAARLGAFLHAGAGLFFGAIYLLAMDRIGAAALPHSLFLGIGIGFFHGLLMSYLLMFYASARHPLEDYRDATLEEGFLHLAGHVLYGAVTGLAGGLLFMLMMN
ncbi:MAG: hypothetical protein ACPGGJ_02220 [Coraliomargarita sp.]